MAVCWQVRVYMKRTQVPPFHSYTFVYTWHPALGYVMRLLRRVLCSYKGWRDRITCACGLWMLCGAFIGVQTSPWEVLTCPRPYRCGCAVLWLLFAVPHEWGTPSTTPCHSDHDEQPEGVDSQAPTLIVCFGCAVLCKRIKALLEYKLTNPCTAQWGHSACFLYYKVHGQCLHCWACRLISPSLHKLRYKSAVLWLLKCMGQPKGYHVLLWAQPVEVHNSTCCTNPIHHKGHGTTITCTDTSIKNISKNVEGCRDGNAKNHMNYIIHVWQQDRS